MFHVEGSHTYTEAGSFFPVITVSSVDPTVLGTTGAIVTIAANPLLVVATPIAGVEGNPIAAGTVVATFTDSVQSDPASAFTATVTFGTLGTFPGTIVSTGGGNFEVETSAAVTFPEEGTFPVTVSVTDHNANGPSGFLVANAFGTATIKDAPLTAAATQPTVVGFQQTPLVQAPPIAGIPASAGVEVAQFTDGNPTAPLSDFTATIDWGDGSPQSAGQVFQPGGPGTAFFVMGNHTYAQPSPAGIPYVVTVTVNDVGGSQVTTHTTAAITASMITGTGLTTATGNAIQGVEEQPLNNVVVAFFTDSGTPGPLSSYSATINWGDGTPSTTGQIVQLGGNNFEVLGSHTYAEENLTPTTPYSVTVSISHNGSLAAIVSSQANIADAPISGVAVPVIATEGAPFTSVVAIFTDTNAKAPLSDYPTGNLVINWGDGTPTSLGTISQPGGPGTAFFVTGTHIYATAGSYVFSVTVTDVGGSTFTAFSTATVGEAVVTATGINSTLPEGPLPANPLPGTVIPTFNVATFVDAGNNTSIPGGVATPADYVATINWGDGVVTTGTISNPVIIGGVPTYTVSGQHLYADEGTYDTTITIRDLSGGFVATTNGVITITDGALTAGAPATAPLTVVEGKSFTLPLVNFVDANLAGTIADFSATITWGDGTTSTGIIGQLSTPSGSPTAFTVTGTHTYNVFTPTGTPDAISVAIRDDGGSTVTVTNTATVLDAPITASTTSSISGIEGNTTGPELIAVFTDSDPGSTIADFTTGGGSVTVNWGDGTGVHTLPLSDISSNGSPTGVTFEVNAAHTYAETGTYQIEVVATDKGGSVTVTGTTAVVADAPLFAGVQPPINNLNEGVSFTEPVGVFVDTNPSAPLSDYSATIDWGDGTPQSAGTITPFNIGAGGGNVITLPNGKSASLWIVTGSHNYDDPFVDNGTGTFPVTIHVKDADGASVNITNTATVAPQTISLTGALNPFSDSGESHTDAITDDNTPNFIGTTEPLATVRLFAADLDNNVFKLVGSTQANAAGQWSITTSKLTDGRYTIWANATDRSGLGFTQTQILPNATQGDLTIDTVDPQVTNVSFDRFDGTIDVTYTDPNLADGTLGSGIDLASITDASNYRFNRPNSPKQQFLITNITQIATGIPGQSEVALQINGGRRIKGGFNFNFTIFTSSPSNQSGGVQDVAGNGLQGEFFGRFPTGNGFPGNLNARLIAFHNEVLPAATLVGTASPLRAAAVAVSGSPAIIGATDVHDLALESVTVPKKHKK